MDEAELARQLLAVLPKPRSANAARLQELLDPAVTLKLDGERTLLMCGPSGMRACTLLGTRILSGPPGRKCISVFDCERIGDHY
jgi:hypothetical protein